MTGDVGVMLYPSNNMVLIEHLSNGEKRVCTCVLSMVLDTYNERLLVVAIWV